MLCLGVCNAMPLRINSLPWDLSHPRLQPPYTVHLGVNLVYASPPQYLPHINSTVIEEADEFTDFSLFLLCLSSQKEEGCNYAGKNVYL